MHRMREFIFPLERVVKPGGSLSLGAITAALALTASALVPARAELLAVAPHGFVSQHVLVLAAPPDRAWQALTTDIAGWWDAEHSFGGKASGFKLDARAGGCFCETLDDGGSIQHMTVVHARPGTRLVLHGGLGPLARMGVAGSMSFELAPHEQGTELRYRYEVGGFTAEGLEGIAPAVDAVQLGQLQRLQAYVAGESFPDG